MVSGDLCAATQPTLAVRAICHSLDPLWFRYAAECLNGQRRFVRRLLNRRWLVFAHNPLCIVH